MTEGRDLSFKDRLVGFLTESRIQGLILLGSAIKHFGTNAVCGALVGAGVVYIYAVIWPLPGARAPQAQAVMLSGEVKTIDNEPLPRFKIAVVGQEFGPFDGGRFELADVKRESYRLMVLPDGGYNPIMVYGIPGGDKPDHYQLEKPLQNFPTHLGRVAGKLTDQTGRALKGEVEVEQRPTIIKPDGSFEVMDIPLANATIKVTDGQKNVLLQEPIRVDPYASTPFDRQIRVPE